MECFVALSFQNRKGERALVLTLNDATSFALADLLLQALVHQADISAAARLQLGQMATEVAAYRTSSKQDNSPSGPTADNTSEAPAYDPQLGWVAISRSLLRAYARLEIAPEEMMALLHVQDRQWSGQQAFPKVAEIALEMGRYEDTVRGYLRRLRTAGFLSSTFRAGRGNEYDMQPLLAKLRDLPVFRPNTHPPQQPMGIPPTLPRCEPPVTLPNHPPSPGPVLEVLTKERVVEKTPSAASRLAAVAGRAMSSAVDARDAAAVRKAETHKPTPPPAAPIAAPSTGNCNDLEFAFKSAWRKKWPNITPKTWTIRERKNAKMFIDEYSYDQVVKTVELVFSQWNELQRKFGWDGYPSLPLVYGWRGSLVPLAVGGEQKPAPPKWGAHHKPEFDRPDGEDGGWG